MRPRRVLAIAERDLRIEFSGRQGAVLPLIVGFILGPVALSPSTESVVPPPRILVWGDIPEPVTAIPDVQVVRDRASVFISSPEKNGTDAWRLRGPALAMPLRDAMNAMDPKIRVVNPPTAGKLPVPERSLLLSLVAASVLAGALAQSIPGERASRTLETLRVASVSPLELVTGKWLAWAGFAGGAAMLAGVIAVVLGHQAPGPWLLPLPWVAGGTAAVGLWLVRRANDVVGGATIALRMQPAALAASALVAWMLGSIHPVLGALVPLGGAVLGSAAIWPGWLPAIVATLSTATVSGLALASTAAALDDPERDDPRRDAGAAVLAGMTALAAWWVAVNGALLWTFGGAAERTLQIGLSAGQTAGAIVLATVAFTLATRSPDPFASIGLVAANARTWALAALVGALLWLSDAASGLAPQPSHPLLALAALRMHRAVDPTLAGPVVFMVAIVSQELVFRGWIQRAGGPVLAAGLAVLALSPLDPLHGAIQAALLAALVAIGQGSVLPAIGARAFGWLLTAFVPGLVPQAAAIVGGVGAILLLWIAAARTTRA